MIEIPKILSTTLFTLGILIVSGRSPPERSENTIIPINQGDQHKASKKQILFSDRFNTALRY